MKNMKNRLILSVFVREITFVEEELDGAKTNQYFSGWLYLQTACLP